MKVILLAAISLDGMIAHHSHEQVAWTGSADKRFFAASTKQAGVVVMGRSTFEAMEAPLTDRLNLVMTHSPEPSQNPDVEYADASPAEILTMLEKRGFNEVVIGGGSQIYTAFLEAGLVDELHLTVLPLIIGDGIPLFARSSPHALTLLTSEHLDPQTVLLKYKPSAS